ncbi:hypothetical protein [Amycolatopsis sp. SID8362]|uniref:hypothetical protein n=1 Tax=Amycolatopsis sp. SID8362 TaxID=2690346 RepID=UPI001EF36E7C|nr:hypothetical protein [Amycolatopsis sp. SID8362]
MAHDRILLLRDRGQAFPLAQALRLSLPRSGVVNTCQLGFEDRSSFGAEEPVGVEPADRLQEFVLADADRRRQPGVEGGLALVVLAGPAEVVNDLLVLHVADHPSAAAVEHPSPEDVLALGLGVVVACVTVA